MTLTKVDVEERFVASLRKDHLHVRNDGSVPMSNQSVGLAIALAEKRRCTYEEVIEWADKNVLPDFYGDHMAQKLNDVNILAKLGILGIDRERLERVMAPKAENWGQLVYAFEVLTVLGIVLEAMKDAE